MEPEGDVGMVETFCTAGTVCEFASSREALERGDDEELFKLLVTVAMLQRLRDAPVMSILRGISAPHEADDRRQRLVFDRACRGTRHARHHTVHVGATCVGSGPSTHDGTGRIRG